MPKIRHRFELSITYDLDEDEQWVNEGGKIPMQVQRLVISDGSIHILGKNKLKDGSLGAITGFYISDTERALTNNPTIKLCDADYDAKYSSLRAVSEQWDKETT